MFLDNGLRAGGYLVIFSLVAAGCRTPQPSPQPVSASHGPTPSAVAAKSPVIEDSPGRCISAAPPSARLTSFHRHVEPFAAIDDPFAGQRELQLSQLLSEVQARNQTLAAMRAAWLAAAQRYPQARALDDPVFTGLLAPASLGSSVTSIPGNTAGYVVGGAQKLPWFGKRELRGEAALAESRAAQREFDDARLQIIEAVGIAFYDYYLVQRVLLLNDENIAKLREFRQIAARKYEANLSPQQDMLQADVELAELARRQIELERMERIALARMNTLLHRPPDAFVPPSPARLAVAPLVLSAAELRATAAAARPDLAALSAQIRAEQARLRLAQKEFMPDMEVFGRYDNFWAQASQRGQVGVSMNVPLYRDKRYAAVREAEWRLVQRRAEYEQRVDDINREVQTAFERFDEAQQAVGLYADQILPAAQKNVGSAFAAYEAGRSDFLRLVAAQRQLIMLQERYQEAIADYHRRQIELERAVGRPLSETSLSERIPRD